MTAGRRGRTPRRQAGPSRPQTVDAIGGGTWEHIGTWDLRSEPPPGTYWVNGTLTPTHVVATLGQCSPEGQTVDDWMRFEFGWSIGSWEWEPADLAAGWSTVAALTRRGALGPSSVVTPEGRLRVYCQTWDARRMLGVLRRAGIADALRFVTWTEAAGGAKVQVGRVTLVSGAGSTVCAVPSVVPARAAS